MPTAWWTCLSWRSCYCGRECTSKRPSCTNGIFSKCGGLGHNGGYVPSVADQNQGVGIPPLSQGGGRHQFPALPNEYGAVPGGHRAVIQ